jgi:3'-5' exoribonuclease
MTLLKDLKTYDNINKPLLITDSSVKTTKNNKLYTAIKLRDRSEEISAMIWSDVPPTNENIQNLQTIYKSGQIVMVSGTIGSYNDQRQLTITNIRPLADNEAINVDELLETGPKNRNELTQTTNNIISTISNPVWYKIVKTLYDNNQAHFVTYPAAKKIHHAVVGGLAFHSTTIALAADALATLYPQLNRDLLISGALIHDMGKMFELSGNIATEYTFDGKMFGHIILLLEMIDDIVKKDAFFNAHVEEVKLLKHVILAHHGKLEWGSPVVPHLLEAQVLHQLDALDANIFAITHALNETETGKWTNKLFSIQNQQFYKSPFLQNDKKE